MTLVNFSSTLMRMFMSFNWSVIECHISMERGENSLFKSILIRKSDIFHLRVDFA
jgi:hypothetical protein